MRSSCDLSHKSWSPNWFWTSRNKMARCDGKRICFHLETVLLLIKSFSAWKKPEEQNSSYSVYWENEKANKDPETPDFISFPPGWGEGIQNQFCSVHNGNAWVLWESPNYKRNCHFHRWLLVFLFSFGFFPITSLAAQISSYGKIKNKVI